VDINDILAKLGGDQGASGGLGQIMKLFGGGGNSGGGNNGLQGMMSQLTSNGMADQVQSWVGQGQNQPVSGDQIRQAVDPALLNRIAEQSHQTPQQVSDEVAQVLPEMINKATPEGQMPAQDPFAKGMGMLKQFMG
jgi:uncharacterized protein YidB (DUF937 family)